MPLLLHIETATDTCSVALSDADTLIGLREAIKTRSHASALAVFIDELFKEKGITANDLDAVAVSKGPGSYTGLRIGVATAKGICYAAGKPLVAVNTLQSMCAAFIATQNTGKALLCPMIDARRMEVYCALFDSTLNFVEPTAAVILNEQFLAEHLKENKIYFFGDGSAKLKPVLENNTNAVFLDNFSSTSTGMITLAKRKFEANDFENVAYFEPFYLKDFVGVK